MTSVASDVLVELQLPELLVRLGGGCVATVFMSMPDTAVDEYNRFVFHEHYVGRAWQPLHMKSIAKATGKKKRAERPLRPSVLPSNARHHSAALWGSREAHGHGLVSPKCQQKTHPCMAVKQFVRLNEAPDATIGSLA